jgi:hypothetical protein
MNNIIKNFFFLFRNYSQSKAIQSIKVKNKKFNSNRYCVEIDVNDISLDKVFDILNSLNCAVEKEKIIYEYKNSSHVTFALELDSKINYRVYFLKQYDINNFNFSAESFIAYDSYKWDMDNNSKILETNYEIFRNLDSKSIFKKIKKTKLFLPDLIEKLVKENDIVQKTHFRKRNVYLNNNFLYKSLNNNCILSIINDSNSSRKSYNISHPLFSVSKLLEENEFIFTLKTNDIFLGFEDEKFDDITIGIDKHKENFMTFYFKDQKVIDFLSKSN